jgi:hypothetical protein
MSGFTVKVTCQPWRVILEQCQSVDGMLLLKRSAARFGLIVTVAVIVVVSVLAPMLKQPLPAKDMGPLAAFAPSQVVPSAATESPTPILPRNRSQTSTSSASSIGAAAAPPEAVTPSTLPSPAPTSSEAMIMPRHTEGSAPASTQPAADVLQPRPNPASTERARAQERAKPRRAQRAVRSRPAPHYDEQMTGRWAYRPPLSTPGSTPFSYQRQLGAQ